MGGLLINYKYIKNCKNQSIVFVHGFTQNQAIFNKQIEYFSDNFNCLTLDLRGHGKSDHNGPFGIEEYTDDIIELLQYLEIDDFIYWGTHTGTAIGLNLYLKKVFSIRLFIFEGVVIPGYNTPGINKNISRAKSIILEKGIDLAINDWFTHSEWFEYMQKYPEETRCKDHFKILKSFNGKPWLSKDVPKKTIDITNKISSFNIPILAYNGRYDMTEFYEMTKILNRNQMVESIIIPNAGGFPLWENPDTVNKQVADWIFSKKASYNDKYSDI